MYSISNSTHSKMCVKCKKAPICVFCDRAKALERLMEDVDMPKVPGSDEVIYRSPLRIDFGMGCDEFEEGIVIVKSLT